MPFQSEKQRRYLWANEPEIARDWTDTYGSRISKDNGGIADLLYGDTLGYGIERPEYLSQNVSLPNINPLTDYGQFYRYPQEEEEEENKFNNVFNMQNFNRYAMPAYNFARGNIGAGLVGGLLGGPLGILGLMFGGQGFKNRRRAKEAARIAEIEKAEEAYQRSKTVAPKPYVAPLGPRGDGGNQGSSMGRGQSPTGSDVAGTPFNIGGLAGLWPR